MLKARFRCCVIAVWSESNICAVLKSSYSRVIKRLGHCRYSLIRAVLDQNFFLAWHLNRIGVCHTMLVSCQIISYYPGKFPARRGAATTFEAGLRVDSWNILFTFLTKFLKQHLLNFFYLSYRINLWGWKLTRAVFQPMTTDFVRQWSTNWAIKAVD